MYFRAIPISGQGFPRLKSDSGCPRYLYKDFFIDSPNALLFKYRKPIPRRPILADYL